MIFRYDGDRATECRQIGAVFVRTVLPYMFLSEPDVGKPDKREEEEVKIDLYISYR